jgi:hypothetical protein
MGDTNGNHLVFHLPGGINPKERKCLCQWRILIDELLETHKDYSTQPDDIKRLILGVPIEPDHVQAPTIVGDLKEKHGK